MDNMVGQTIGDRYRFEAFLGRGGMANVYKVWDLQRSASLAMKMLHSDLAEDKVFVRRFRREAETLAQLQHPSIIRFYGLEEIDGHAFILMDFVEGSSLRSEIARAKQPLSAKRILEVLRPVCSALNYAHRLGVVHCDMKPANILIDSAGKAYVSDFGIARVMEHATTTTLTGAGTPAYMAPEQIRGEALSPQSDLYALGIILYEMLTGGERPFTGDTAPQSVSTAERVRWEHLHQQASFPVEFEERIAPQVAAVVLRCLAKAPEKRYPSAMEMLLALERGMAAALAQQLGVPYEEPVLAPDPHGTEALLPKPTLVLPTEQATSESPPPTVAALSGARGAAPPARSRAVAQPPSPALAQARKAPLVWLTALFILLLLATCGVLVLGAWPTDFVQRILAGGATSRDMPVALTTPSPLVSTETQAQPAPSDTPVPTSAPSVTLAPSATSLPGPRAYGFETCAGPCNGANAQSRFPGGITELHFRYRYENIPPGAHYERYWEVPGKGVWVRYDCVWDGPERGELALRLWDTDGLQSGTWIMTVKVDDAVLLREQVVLTGDYNFWTPVERTITTCR